MKQSKRSVETLLAANSERRVNVAIGDEIVVSDGGQTFGSGGFSARSYWQSEDGTCPVEVVSEVDKSSSFVSETETRLRFVGPGVVRCYSDDDLREKPFIDSLWVCDGSAKPPLPEGVCCNCGETGPVRERLCLTCFDIRGRDRAGDLGAHAEWVSRWKVRSPE